jgi:hypothetical protein
MSKRLYLEKYLQANDEATLRLFCIAQDLSG